MRPSALSLGRTAILCLAAAGCTAKEPARPPVAPIKRAITVPSGFDWLNIELNTASPLLAPMQMTIAPDGRVFVCEQAGKIRVVKNDVLLPTPLLTIPNVDPQSDGGLQAIVLDPAFATVGAPGKGRFFVYYHRNAISPSTYPVGRVATYQISSTNPDLADPTPVAQLDLNELRTPSGGIAGLHIGGTLAVGTDGMLYLALGSADVSQADQLSYAHSAGKVLRMRLGDLGPAAGNPFETTGSNEIMKRVWARGVRNPFGMSVRRSTGRMFFDDVGSNHVVTPSTRPPKNAWEETSLIPNPGETPGVTGAPFDFGWPLLEGDGPHLVHVYRNGQANENTGGQDCAKIGGTFYDPPSPSFPSPYIGGYFYTDYCSGYIDWLPPSQQAATVDDGNPNTYEVPANVPTRFVETLEIAPTDLEVGPDGSLYFLGRGSPERAPSAVGFMGKIFTSGPVPQVSVTSPIEGDRFSTSGTGAVDVSVTAVASDNNGGVSLIELFVNGTIAIGSCPTSPCVATAADLPRGTHRFTARATNVVGGQKTSTPVNITVDGPTAVISTPSAGSSYVAGTSIAFSGSGTNFDGSSITSAAAFVWNIYLRHGTHSHLAQTTTGLSGSFVPSTTSETDPNVFYDVVLTVTDSFGTAHSAKRSVVPVKPTLTLASSPASGLSIKLEGAYKTTPFAFQSVAGIVRLLDAPQKQTGTNGRRYAFLTWSDGNTDFSRYISTPQVDTTYTANFRDATGSGTGLHAEYFADGTLTSKIFERSDATVDFDWGTGAPAGLPADDFSVRWSGKVQPFFSEGQTFYVEADGSVRLWFKGVLIIDSWNESSSERVSVDQGGITGGTQYDIKLEYREAGGPARVKLYWAASGVLKEIIPGTQSYPAVVLTPQNPALLVVSSTPPTSAADLALQARLQGLGLATDIVTAAALTTTSATAVGRKVVVVSETVASTEVNTKLRNAPVAVVVHEPSIMDDMGMTGTTLGTHYGDAPTQTALAIAAPASPLAAGLSGTATVVTAPSNFIWGVPGPSASIVATLVGNSTQAAIYAYDAGAVMVVGTAPARRLGSFVQGTTPGNLNANGWALFDAGIRWAANLAPPVNGAPVVSAGPDQAATVAVTATISGTASDDGLPLPPALSVAWTTVSGPGTPTWPQGDQNQAVTHVQFPVAGSYVLRLSASDGTLSASDDVVVTVTQPTVASPTISPNGGVVSAPVTVSLATTTTGAEIRYTLDASEPTQASALYASAFSVSGTTTVKAKGFKAGYVDSGTASATFTFTVATPTISPNGGTFTSAQTVTLATTTPAAELRYTTDGTNPTATSTLYSAPFSVSTSRTIKAMGFKSGSTNSAIASATFTITGKTALFVVGNLTLPAGDTALRNRLQTKGFTVTVKTAASTVTADITGKSLVLISESAPSNDVGTKFTAVAVPVINCDAASMDNLGMTGTTSSDQGTQSNQTVITIAAAGNPLAAGLTGSPAVTTVGRTMTWGKPGASATVVARISGSSTKAAIFKYESGATMISGVAPSRRMGFFTHTSASQSLNTSGWALFDAALAWAAP